MEGRQCPRERQHAPAVSLQSLLQLLLHQEMSKLFSQVQKKTKYENSSFSQLVVGPKVAGMAQTLQGVLEIQSFNIPRYKSDLQNVGKRRKDPFHVLPEGRKTEPGASGRKRKCFSMSC